RDIPVTTTEVQFRPDEMTVCGQCGRQNPPNRYSCLYCGSALDSSQVRSDLAQINFQPPESWEDGFSVIYTGKNEISSGAANRAADLLRIEIDKLIRLTAVGVPVPVAYLKSLPDAELLAARLTEIGLDCAIVGDDLLTPEMPPTRIRSIEFF